MIAIFQKAFRGILAISGLTLALPAMAVVIPYTVSSVAPQQYASPVIPPADAPWGTDGYPGDTIELQSYSGTFDLSVGTSIQKINTLLWIVNYTYGGTATDPNAWSDVASAISLSRQIQLGTETATLTQTGLLNATWANDYLNLDAGSTITLHVGNYQVDITPLAASYGGEGSDGGATTFDGGNPWAQPAQDLYAQFVVTESSVVVATPEPRGIAMLIGLAAISCGGSAVSRFRKKNASIQ